MQRKLLSCEAYYLDLCMLRAFGVQRVAHSAVKLKSIVRK